MIARSPCAPRRGSIFIFTFGLLIAMVALAYSFMVSTRIRRDADETVNLRALAEGAARDGAAHALAVITADYLARPGVPTNLNQDWRRGFAPIDTDRVGKHASNANAYRPVGDPGTWEDENENDTKTESLLTTVYNSTYAGGGTYAYRGKAFNEGRLLHNGLGRYIEPGHFHSDLAGRPVSFHLDHPVAAIAGDPDPAVRRGEPWTPDRNTPLYLDHDLLPVDTRAEARYRLRYAVAIEDLSGHLPMSWQGTWTPGVNDARTVAITDTEAAQVAEVDATIATGYRDAFLNLYGGSKGWFAWLNAQGLGSTRFTPDTDTNHSLERYRILADMNGGNLRRFHQTSSSSRPDTRVPLTSGHVWASQRGPLASAGAGRAFLGKGPDAPALTYTYTPYGRRPEVAAAPSAWRDSYTACPWQINLPTAVPEAVTRMVYAYLPREALTFLYNTRHTYVCTSIHPDTGVASWSSTGNTAVTITQSIPMLDLFASSDFAAFFAHLPGGQPYPGSDPGAPGPAWRNDLGKDINLNTTTFDLFADSDPTIAEKRRLTCPRPPFWGMGTSYLPDLKNDYTELEQPWVGGSKHVITMPSATMQTFTKADGYWYEDSYYHDLAVALFHAIAVAQLAWMDDNGASWDGDPLAGRPAFPTTLTHPDLLPLLSDGLPAGRDRDLLDRDADGDGTVDSPSAFDTIREVDAQFVRNLGEYFGAEPASPAVPGQGLYLVKIAPSTYKPITYRNQASLVAWTPSHNLATLLAGSLVSPAEADLMELAINDMRMSFFGASPQYADFRGIDFDNDGTVRCSAYAGGSCPVGADRFGRLIDPASGDARFSLTGCFLLQKSRFFRTFIRGEVYDTVRMVPVEATTLEVVYAVDPEGRLYDVNNVADPARRDPDGNGDPRDAAIGDSQTLFQRWHWIRHGAYRAKGRP